MSTLRQLLISGLLVGVLTVPASAQNGGAATHPGLPEVQQLAEAFVTALNGNDPASAVEFFHPDCLVTWASTETSRGHEGLRAFHQFRFGGPVRRVESFNCEVRVDDTVQVFAEGQAALACGGFNERFKLPGGRKIDLQGRWSATLTKDHGRWLIVNLQLSVDPFANSLLNLAKQAGWVVGVVSLLAGAGAGWMVGRKKGAPGKL